MKKERKKESGREKVVELRDYEIKTEERWIEKGKEKRERDRK